VKCTGFLEPLKHRPARPVQYELKVDDQVIPLNDYLGSEMEIRFLDELRCRYCGRKTKKFYGNNSSCFPCFKKLPINDLCIVKPELCHFHQGTCRDNAFGEHHCMCPHIVYLALSSDIKVGITRKSNRFNRWIDQGAVQALPILEVATRKDAGEAEVFLSQFITDKTNWRKMLKNEINDADLYETRKELIKKLPERFQPYILPETEIHEFTYPQLQVPDKITSLNFKKQPAIRGTLIGIKAQYLIFDTGVFQVRKHAGYKISISL
jgi:hypothetical protein